VIIQNWDWKSRQIKSIVRKRHFKFESKEWKGKLWLETEVSNKYKEAKELRKSGN
jgi:hypothetical protein